MRGCRYSGSLSFLPDGFGVSNARSHFGCRYGLGSLRVPQQRSARQCDERRRNLSAENIVSNDVTAIDAVTGDAANMAADINYTDTSDNSVAALPQSEPMAKVPKSRPATASRTTESTAPAPTNTSDNGTE